MGSDRALRQRRIAKTGGRYNAKYANEQRYVLKRVVGDSMARLAQTSYSEAMNTLFQILIPLSLAAVTAALFVGLYALFKGGDFGRSNSNKLMRLRVLLQFVAILVLVAAAWWRRH
jgi:Hypoxia induced protein conserved region